MSKLFDEDYYHEEDVKKPVFSDSDDDLISKLYFIVGLQPTKTRAELDSSTVNI